MRLQKFKLKMKHNLINNYRKLKAEELQKRLNSMKLAHEVTVS